MKILAATDGSKYGRWAVQWPAGMPFTVKPTVRVLHVLDIAGLRAPFMMQPRTVGMERCLQAEITRMEAQAEKTQKEAGTLLKESGMEGSVVVDRGGVAATIMKYAKRGVNLLSIGSRGLDALDRFMLGSASNHAIHHAPCSVVVVKEAPRLVRKILLAVDGSSASEKAVRFLLRHVDPTPDGSGHASVLVIVTHVLPFVRYSIFRQAGKGLVHRYGVKVAKAGFQVREAMRSGKPAEEILTEAKQEKVDLIVTGKRGLGTFGRVFLGSVATRVVQHAACSVLVVR